MKFRNDIQVLRGYAVLLVVAFHLGLNHLKSGFLGVDVFFVISGFLMATLYDHNDKKFFFLRRAKRLLPAYFVTILLTLIVSIFIVTPHEFNSVMKQSIYSSFFISNIGFWLENSYFSKAAFNPLLNLWSLGVEIQFYLIIPLLCWFFRKVKLSFYFFALVSISLCFFILTISPKTSFFMMPLRIWEFLIGFFVAKKLTDNGNVIYNKKYLIFGSISFSLLIFIPFFDVNGESLNIVNGHPGLYALIVALLTGCVLTFGLSKSFVNSLIGRLFIGLGKYSYSIYLVHFPIIVLFLYEPFGGTILKSNNYISLPVLLFLISLLSYLMHNFIELRKVKNINMLSFTSICSILFLSFIGLIIQKSLITEKEYNIFNVNNDRAVYRCGKINRIIHPTDISCDLTPEVINANENVLLVGTSHADSIKQAFVDIAIKNNKKVYFMVSNTPLIEGDSINVDRLIIEANNKNSKLIVLHYKSNSIKLPVIKDLVSKAKNRNIKIAYISPVPIYDKNIPRSLYDNFNNNGELPNLTKKDYSKLNSEFIKQLNEINEINFHNYDVVNYFCDQTCKYVGSNGKPFYFDSHHLTITGSKILNPLYEKILSGS